MVRHRLGYTDRPAAPGSRRAALKHGRFPAIYVDHLGRSRLVPGYIAASPPVLAPEEGEDGQGPGGQVDRMHGRVTLVIK